MAYVKKISDEQFLLDCINKEFEIIGSTNHWDTFSELCEWTKQEENREWYTNNAFSTSEQWKQWKQYFMEHFYDWKPKRYSKHYIENRVFPWFNLQYGFPIREN